MNLLSIVLKIGHALKGKQFTIVTKSQESLGLASENIKTIISPHDGGYILIRWS
jgi:hypothetical protein